MMSPPSAPRTAPLPGGAPGPNAMAGGGAPPNAGMGPGPSAGGMPTPEEITAQVEAALPEPAKGGYSPKLLADVADAATEAMVALMGDAAPAGAVVPAPDGDGKGKLPVTLMVPVLLLSDLAISLGGEAGARYAIDPAELVDDSALRMVLAKLQTMAKDKKLKKAIDAAMTGGAPAPAKGKDDKVDTTGPMPEKEEDTTAEEPMPGGMKEPPPIPKSAKMAL